MSGHRFVRPGQVAPDRPAPDACMECGRAAAGHRPAVTSQLEDQAAALGVALALWATRDDSKAQPEVSQAGHAAIEAIDAMLAGLHRARQQLIGEIRDHQDAAMARADALLARLRHERPGGRP